MMVVLGRPESPYQTVEVVLQSLDAAATYELSCDSTGSTDRVTGAELMDHFPLTVPDRHRSDLGAVGTPDRGAQGLLRQRCDAGSPGGCGHAAWAASHGALGSRRRASC